MHTAKVVAGAIIIPVLLVLFDYIRVLVLRRKLPPGPVPLPIFGSYFITPLKKPWIVWDEWSKYYQSPLITVWNGHRPCIICHDAWTASDLMEKRAAIYSSRPNMPSMGDMIASTNSNQVCLPYGDKWRLHRRLLVSQSHSAKSDSPPNKSPKHTAVGSQAIRDHQHFQSNEGIVLMHDLMMTPDKYVLCIERYSVSVASIIGWGRRIDKINDPVAQTALAIMEGVDLVVPCNQITEVIPALIRLPKILWSYPSVMRAAAKIGKQYFFDLSQEAVARGDNYAKRLLTAKDQQDLSEAEIASLTSNLIGGGVDTTSSSIISFILAMCVFVEVQKKGQAEIDKVLGGRCPTIDDQDSLPYINAVVSEVLRWRTVTILGGIPHAPIQDDMYNNYHIPKGTGIYGNVWAIHRHPREFPAPDSFRPERFLEHRRPYPVKKGHNAFGWGRRQCSGQPLAEQGLFMVIARMLWSFDVKPGLDDEVS